MRKLSFVLADEEVGSQNRGAGKKERKGRKRGRGNMGSTLEVRGTYYGLNALL